MIMATPPDIPSECKLLPPGFIYQKNVKLIDISAEIGNKSVAMTLETRYTCDGKAQDTAEFWPLAKLPEVFDLAAASKRLLAQLPKFRDRPAMTCRQLSTISNNVVIQSDFRLVSLLQSVPIGDKKGLAYTARLATEILTCEDGEASLIGGTRRTLLVNQAGINRIQVSGKNLMVMDFDHPFTFERGGKKVAFVIDRFVMDMAIMVDGTILPDRIGVVLVPSREADKLTIEMKRFEALKKQFEKKKERHVGEELKDLAIKIKTDFENLKKQTITITAGALTAQLEKQAQVR